MERMKRVTEVMKDGNNAERARDQVVEKKKEERE